MLKKILDIISKGIFSFFVITGLLSFHPKEEKKSTETGKIKWPEINQETRPWTRWWWFGNAVAEKDLTAALEAYQKAGLGGVEITPIYGVRGTEDQFINFLSPAWMAKLSYTLKEAKRLGLGVDVANASGWPFGGPWVDDQIACKNIVSKVFNVQGGDTLTEIIRYVQRPLVRTASRKTVKTNALKKPITANEDLQEYAFDQVRYEKELPLIIVTASKIDKNGFTEVIDLTNKVTKGQLRWTAPEGKWVVCALFQGDHGKMVERAGPGGEGNVIDHFSAEALEKYLNKFDTAFKGYDLSHLRYFFNDSYEVDDAQGESNWTPDLFSAFKTLRGYDLTRYIPALLGLDSEEMNSRVLYDYRMTISDLLLEKYTKNWQNWAAKQGKGIRNQAHGSPANVLDLYAASDIPEIEGTEIVNLKSAPSAAHISGKKLTSSESATWLNEHFQSNLGDVKGALDKLWLAGVNHVFYHGTAYSPQQAKWPGWLFYAAVHFTPANSLWEDFGAFNQYAARAQSFLQAGKPSNDILLYFGLSDLWSEPGNSMLKHFHSNKFFDELSLKACGDYLSRQGYSWDALSDKQLIDVTYQNATLSIGGNVYTTIVIPELRYIPSQTFKKLMALARQGATIVFHKSLPSDVPGLADLITQGRKDMTALKENLSFTSNETSQIAVYGKGKIILLNDLSNLTANTNVAPEEMYAVGLQCIRRLKDDGNYYYFINNPSQKPFQGWITLNTKYSSAALYNLMSGIDGYANTRGVGDKTEVYLQLKPAESIVVETFKGNYKGIFYPYYDSAGRSFELSDWKIVFVKGGPALPAGKTTKKLQSWTNYGPAYRVFSGTAEYYTTIPSLPIKADAWRLDLGDVHESAAVFINGNYLGTCFGSPYNIEIPSHMLKGNDELKIRVSNLMANRIADLDRKGVEWRIFYNTNFNARNKMNTGKDGKFTAKNWTPISAGLIGPVVLAPLLNMNMSANQ